MRKASQRFGCERVTFVGGRGTIKSGQIEELSQAGFHYITAIAKPQIDTLLSGSVLPMALFDDLLCEVEQESVRCVLRRNPVRAAEMAATRAGKQTCVEALVQDRNQYLTKHSKAKVSAAEKKGRSKIAGLKAAAWLRVESAGRSLKIVADEAVRAEAARLDGCCAIQTDLPATAASKQVVHDRCKDLTDVEMAFRTSKTAHLEMRPIYVRTVPARADQNPQIEDQDRRAFRSQALAGDRRATGTGEWVQHRVPRAWYLRPNWWNV